MKNKNAQASALGMLLVFITPYLGAEVIVTGSAKRPLNASPITVLTADMIANSALTDLSDIIQQTPGVRVSGFTPGGTATIRIRGFDSISTPTFVDGVLMNPGALDLNAIPTDLIDRVEILSGPQGTLFGRSPTAGAINVITSPDFQPSNPLSSYGLNDLTNALTPYWLAFDSKEECDATHGSPMPLWTFNPYTNYGNPYVSKDRDFWAWGDQGDGYEPPSLYLPQPDVGFEFENEPNEVLTASKYTFNEFNKLRVRIRDYPDAADEDKQSFIFGLFFGSGYLGYGSLSDDASLTGNFDPEAIFQEFTDWSKRRADTEREAWSGSAAASGFHPYAGVEDIPAVPDASSGTPPPSQAVAQPEPKTPDAESFGDVEFGLEFDIQDGNSFNLKLHYEYADTGDGAPTGPASGIAGSLSRYGYGYGPGVELPFNPEAIKDIESAAGWGSPIRYTDALGIMTFPNSIRGYLVTDTPLNLRSDYEYEDSFDLGASYSYGAFKNEIGKDFTIYVDYDSNNRRGGRSIGVRIPYQKIDSVYLETVPGYNQYTNEGNENGNYESELFNKYGTDYFSIGGKNFYTYTYPEYGDFDFSLLDKEKGATYWTNNECGDPALPPEGSGYLTADESPVKSVGDQWALEHVGLKGDEPALDEFAKPVIVAVIDTGLDWHHLDFSWDNLWRNENEIPENGIDDDNNGYTDDIIGWSFTDNRNRPWDNDGHGTFVAGIIAAEQGNNAGIDGVSGSARIMVLKALNNFGRTRATLIAKAIVYAADNGAQLVNLSVTGPGFPKIVQDAVDYAAEKGVLVINAAGNKAENVDVESGLLRGVLTVAATGSDDKRAIFSNYGNAIDIAAPGVDVVSLRARATDFMYNSAETSYVKEDAFLGEDRRYYRGTGTSFATPIVTGIASLVLANNPGLEPAELKRVLKQSARDVEVPGVDRLTGYGMIDAKAALATDPAFYVDAGIALVRPVQRDGRTYVQVGGLADAEVFGTASLEIGQGEDPASWTNVGTIVEPVHMGELGRIPIEQFEGAATWTIRLTVTHLSGSSRESRYVVDL